MKTAPVLTGVLILVIEKRSPTVQRLKALGLHIGRFGRILQQYSSSLLEGQF